MNIDFHAHVYPEDYLKKLEASTGDVRIETDNKGEKWILSMGAKAGPITPDFFDLDVRVDRITETRVDMQILSSPHPGVDRFSPEESAEMSRVINNGIAKAVRQYPKRFQGIAMLPLIDTRLALRELDRAILELGLKGMCMLTNVAGKTPDSDFLLPVYERAQQLGVPIFIHPTTPLGAQVMQEWRLAIILGFEFDIVLSATRLAYAGVLDRFPELRFVISHLGAGIPFLAGRIDRGYHDPTCGIKTKKPTSEYLRELYCDTVSFYQPALAMAYEFYGASRMVLGSDFPLIIGDLPAAVPSIEAMPIPNREKEKILGENVKQLLKLDI
ncbi:MAG TPA: amidohydrolase family protein [Candidatus Binatia bacterium]|jgi:aminocarboxymuconate-semialdehyde decarboxylase|nr:amidohydrolase family protein [Candidatus Binatia bacterium]